MQTLLQVEINSFTNPKVKYENIKLGFVVICLLVSSRFWSFHGIPERIFDILEISVVIALLMITLINYHKIHKHSLQFKTNVQLFIWLPLFSSIAAALFHQQSFSLSLLMLRTIFYWLLYFVLHIFDFDTKKILILMITIGLVWVTITVVQQFTYPVFFFYNRNGEDGQEFYRAGLYRFMIDPLHFGMFLPLYSYSSFLNSKKFWLLFLTLIGLVGLYVFSTRQFAVAVIICMIIDSLRQKGTTRLWAILFIMSIGTILIIYKDVLLYEFIDMTNEQINSKDEIRKLSADFYLYEYWPHWITFFIGNGIEHDNSVYGKEMMYIKQFLGFFRTDVGIIGSLNYFGVGYVLNVLFVNLKGLRSKYYSESNRYLRFFFLIPLMLIGITDFSFYPSAIPFFCLIFFLVDKTYKQHYK